MNEFQKALEVELKQAYEDRVADQVRELPWLEAYRKIQQDQWNALPWYTKRYKRLQGWIYWTRRSVGEWIAGEKFSNDY